MKKVIVLFFGISISWGAISQTVLSGTITDASTGEALIGATVVYGKGMGTATDFAGNYSISIQPGERHLKISYVGYEEISKTVSIIGNSQILDFKLKTITLNEVQVVADVARDRQTPVAFSTIPIKKISEELASQDIPMILNSTPGVYATQSGGGPRTGARSGKRLGSTSGEPEGPRSVGEPFGPRWALVVPFRHC